MPMIRVPVMHEVLYSCYFSVNPRLGFDWKIKNEREREYADGGETQNSRKRRAVWMGNRFL